jgi:hypothetical protein
VIGTAFKKSTLTLKICFIVLVGASLVLAHEVVSRMIFELHGTYDFDAQLFITVGRGILNGLTPYRDLFESKPPGIFLLSAASLWLSNDVTFAKIVQAVSLGGIPLIMVFVAWRETISLKRDLRILSLLLSFIFGSSLALYTAFRAGEMIPESFGVFFGLLYIATISMRSKRENILYVVAAIFLAVALGMEETFLPLLAAAIVLSPSMKWFISSFVYPLVIALLLGIVVMQMFSFLGPYLTIYLPHMVGFQIFLKTHVLEAFLPMRGLLFHKLIGDFFSYSPSLVLSFFVVWIGTVLLLLKEEKSRKKKNAILYRWFIASYLMMLSVGLSGTFYPHHYAVAIPTLFSFSILFIRVCIRMQKKAFVQGLVGILFASLLVFTIAHQKVEYTHKVASWEKDQTFPLHAASTVDDILDRCNLDRYINLIDKRGAYFAYTKHSPIGPIFSQYSIFFNGLPLYEYEFREAVARSVHMVVLHEEEFTGFYHDFTTQMQDFFSTSPWPCAQPFEQPSPYMIFFRTHVWNCENDVCDRSPYTKS